MRKLKFVGSQTQKKYVGDELNCFVEHPNTCLVEVSNEKAEQLLYSFPTWWEEILDPFIEELRKVIENPKYRGLTKDKINDYAAKNFPDLELDMKILKKDMAIKVLGAAL